MVAPLKTDPAYERMKEAARERNASISRKGRDIGELPAVVDPQRKAAARLDLELFCLEYLGASFGLPFCDDHRTAIRRLQTCVLEGGLFALAMPRGSGKTTLCEAGALWALLYGHREFVCLIGASEDAAKELLDSLKTEMSSNDLLLEDFPEVCYPIHCLEGISGCCSGQLHQGKRTHISWTADTVVLPTIEGSPASASIVKVAGLTGRVRGMRHKRTDGRPVRPSLVIVDDPQTDASARSVSQCYTRERLLAGAVLGLAGPGKKICGVMPCTVIRPGDVADNILDRKKHPEWNGERTKLLYEYPTNEKLWEEYAEIRTRSYQAYGDHRLATEFYREHREAMDEGAVVAWAERYEEDELSAVQNAMNLKLKDEAAFLSEYQNDPPSLQDDDLGELSADQISLRINRIPRRRVPLAASKITAFIDVQGTLLYYLVAAWEPNFTGYVIDYGSWPDQQRDYFTLETAKLTLSSATGIGSLEGSLYAGFAELTEVLLEHDWQREDGAGMRIDKLLIDANWGLSTDTVYQFCRESKHSGTIMPSHGRFIGASGKPISDYKKKPGDQVGHNWIVPSVKGKRQTRHVTFDTNYWKSFIHSRFATPMGERGSLTLYGDNPNRHRMFSEHQVAEYRVRTVGRGRRVDEWKERPERLDNHLFDGMVGAAVAASMEGAVLEGSGGQVAQPKKRRRVSFAELQQRRASR